MAEPDNGVLEAGERTDKLFRSVDDTVTCENRDYMPELSAARDIAGELGASLYAADNWPLPGNRSGLYAAIAVQAAIDLDGLPEGSKVSRALLERVISYCEAQSGGYSK